MLHPKNLWEVVYTGSLFCIEKHTTKGWERAVRPPGVRLLLTDSNDNILLTKEYRNELGGYDIRLPGGKVFDELTPFLEVRENEDVLLKDVFAAASNEAREEAGVLAITDMSLFAKSTLGATVIWDLYYVQGKISSMGTQELEADELTRGISVHMYNKSDVLSLLSKGAFHEERTAAVLRAFLMNEVHTM